MKNKQKYLVLYANKLKKIKIIQFYKKHKKQKFQNKVKYSDKSKINSTALPVPKGSVSVMLNICKTGQEFNLENFKKKIPTKSKFKMKWKTIQQLLQNKQDVLKQLFSNYQTILRHARSKSDGMNRQEFGDLLTLVGLGADINLGDKLFYIFDEDNSQTVDYKELIVGLEMFKENSIENKLIVFMELCNLDHNGNINQQELYKVLKQNLFSEDSKLKLKQIIRQIFKDNDLNKDGLLSKEELLQAATNNIYLLQLLDDSIQNVKKVDQLIENDLEEPFHRCVPISANLYFFFIYILFFVKYIQSQYQFQGWNAYRNCQKIIISNLRY
ncbi:hypothetical protein IMG5_165020 [Ichthyophthirius multifiliis]|uniref:EF-hand domain-containing protein n=1 Tax=Ichthyophthirius multifiliis TaxID=5932 RepID=G0R0I2_ICHMU|nr:hypothetical protein IMG5_165020 [Ichthyophthirius multifiliis]EGR29033.1 hypothetical protein IMG5_165020 [Ichthyophthirius multifiliis]|eukprot:XP_004030269.1 hypothetical protein IMG5_165020 [Ichthyophthirius multifiliis]